MTVLAGIFANLRRYRKEQGRLLPLVHHRVPERRPADPHRRARPGAVCAADPPSRHARVWTSWSTTRRPRPISRSRSGARWSR
ncbi:MAG: hypothetical protein WDO24_23440 [Pseudomonadota bacterium]